MAAETVAAALTRAAAALARASDTPRLDAEMLMAHALGVTRGQMLLDADRTTAPGGVDALLARRQAGEPVAYITGRRGFWDMDLIVTPAVLIPRPDSETLIEAARDAFAGHAPPATILDLGTGSGALLLAALRLFPGAAGIGIDASGDALTIAAANAGAHDLTRRATFQRRDWRDHGWADALGRFDLILANPPYVATGAPLMAEVRDHEPAAALFAGADGLDAYRCLIPALPGLMAPAGVAVVELGAGQAAAVGDMAAAAGLTVASRSDLGGHVRALIVRA